MPSTFVFKATPFRLMRLRRWLYSEFIEGRTLFDYLFLLTGLALQAVVWVVHPSSYLSLLSAVCGIFSVILCSQRKISTFFFGFVQITTYLFLALQQLLYAEVAMNMFYLLSQFYGLWVWRRRYEPDSQTTAKRLQPRRMSVGLFALILSSALLLSWLTGYLLSSFTADTQPYLDAFTTLPAIVAQVLMVMAYREQWFVWLLIDVLSVVMWLRAGDYALAAQYAFWCANCIYGLRQWKATDR